MITILGIYKGIKKRDYDFKNNKGESISGTSHNAYLEMAESELAPDETLKEIKLPTSTYVVNAKKGDVVEWVIDINKAGKIFLIKEVTIKK